MAAWYQNSSKIEWFETISRTTIHSICGTWYRFVEKNILFLCWIKREGYYWEKFYQWMWNKGAWERGEAQALGMSRCLQKMKILHSNLHYKRFHVINTWIPRALPGRNWNDLIIMWMLCSKNCFHMTEHQVSFFISSSFSSHPNNRPLSPTLTITLIILSHIVCSKIIKLLNQTCSIFSPLLIFPI